MKKIYWLIQQLERLGGAEMISINIMNELATDPNYDINLVCTTKEPPQILYEINPNIHLSYLNIPIEYNCFEYAFKTLLNQKHFLKAFSLLLKTLFHILIRRFHYRNLLKKMTTTTDIIIASSWDNYIITPRKRTVFYHFHFNSIFYYSFTNWIGLLLCRKPNKFIFLSAETFKKIAKDKKKFCSSIYLYNPVRFQRALHLDFRERKILFLGRFSNQKRPLLALKVANELKNRKIFFHLNMVGAGELESKMQQYITSHSLSDVVTIQPATRDVLPLLHQHDLLLMTSAYEGFALVMLEALSQSVPVITTPWGDGVSEAIKNGENGYIVSKHDELELAIIIEKILNNSDLLIKLKQSAYESSALFSMDTILAQWKNLLSNY